MIYYRYIFNKECFTFVIHHFVRIVRKIDPNLLKECRKRLRYIYNGTSKKTANIDFCAIYFYTQYRIGSIVGEVISKISTFDLFICLGFYVPFNTVQVISRRVVGRAEETSTYSLSRFCTVNCRPTASNYQLSHLSPCGDRTPASGRRECYHSATVAPISTFEKLGRLVM